MQYKQVLRIGMEIFSSPDTLEKHESFPKLGPYRKRSPEQALWRTASNAHLGGVERWEALSHLLQMRTATEIAAEGKDALQTLRPQTHGNQDSSC